MINMAKEIVETTEEKEDSNVSPSGIRIFWREIVRDKLALGSLILFVLITLTVFIGSAMLDLKEVTRIDILSRFLPPSDEHVLGTDTGGRDILGQLIIGTRNSLLIGILVTAMSGLVGILFGLTAGYFGGTIDNILMRVLDFFLILPFLMIVIIFVSLVPTYSIITFSLIMTAFLWMGIARLVRAKALQERELDYVNASKTLGTSNITIMFTHVFPNITSIIIVNLTLSLAANIGIESGLSFLGFGFPESTPSLGTLLSYATNPTTLEKRWWVWLPAAILILVLMLSVRNIGEALKRASDAQQRRG